MGSLSDNTKRNEKKIATRVIILVAVFSILYLFTCDWNDEIYFHYAINQRTGEPIGFIGSIIIYAVMWGLLGLIISPSITLISMLTFRHINKNAFNVFVPSKVTYIAVLILIILHVSNIATFALF